MQVYNIKGQKIRTLVKETNEIGNFVLFWDGREENGNLLANGK
jgi:flagellar hook assembly protein FlgD